MNLVQRAQNILFKPQQEWQVIEGEQTQPGELYAGYIAPLAAIGPIALIIGLSVIGVGVGAFGSFRFPFRYSIVWALVFFVLNLVMVYVLALIIDALAPSFSSQKNLNQAFKLAAYSLTPAWVGGILFILIYSLEAIALLIGLYGIFLLFLGVPVLMKTPQDKSAPYTGVIALIMIVLDYAIWQISWRIALSMFTPESYFR